MQSLPTRIALSGASGMLGKALGEAVAARDVPVVRLVRRPPIGESELEWHPDRTPPIASPGSLDGLSTVIHLSGANVAAHRWTRGYKREMTTSRVDTTRALAVALASLHRPPEVLLVASAVGIYGDRGDEPLNENSAPGSGFLASLCEQWEAAADPARQAGIRVVHLRFGVVLGRAGALARMLPTFRLGLGGPLGSGKEWMSWISLDDAVAAILFVLDTPSLDGPVNITAPNPVTNAEFTSALSRQLHRPAILPAPAFALRLALGEMADEALLASARVLPAKLPAAGFQFVHPKIDQALEAALRTRALS